MSNIYTLQRRSHRLGYFNTGAAAIIEVMRRGVTLHLHHSQDGERWTLSNGKSVSAKTAAHVVLSPLVIGETDSLFAGVKPQTYRHKFASGIAPTRSL
jgi:hypothetical protein